MVQCKTSFFSGPDVASEATEKVMLEMQKFILDYCAVCEGNKYRTVKRQ